MNTKRNTVYRIFVWLLSTHSFRFKGLLSHLIAFSDTHKHGWTPLNEGSACRQELWKRTTRTRDIHFPSGIRTRNPSKRTAADPALHHVVTGIGHFQNRIRYIEDYVQTCFTWNSFLCAHYWHMRFIKATVASSRIKLPTYFTSTFSNKAL